MGLSTRRGAVVPQFVAPVASVADATATVKHVGNHELLDVRSLLAMPHVHSADRDGPPAAPARSGSPAACAPVPRCCPCVPVEIGWAIPLGSRTFPAHRGPGGGFVMT